MCGAAPIATVVIDGSEATVERRALLGLQDRGSVMPGNARRSLVKQDRHLIQNYLFRDFGVGGSVKILFPLVGCPNPTNGIGNRNNFGKARCSSEVFPSITDSFENVDANQTPGSTYTVQVSGLISPAVGPGPCAPAPTVVSRKVHGGGAGTFDIPMPLTGASGVEDRTGDLNVAGNHTIVLSYSSDPTGATATVAADNPASATGSVSGVSYSGNDMIVSLTGVTDQQVLTLSTSGGTVSPTVVPLGFLAGDTTGDRAVNAADIGQTKSKSGQTLDLTNFRNDVNVDGSVNAGDIGLVKSKSGDGLP